MILQKITIINKQGLHARPASNFVKLAAQFKSTINVINSGKSVNAKSIVGIMSAGVKCGMEIELSCDGADEEAAMLALTNAINSGLGE